MIRISRVLLLGVLIIAVIAGIVWEFVPLPGAETVLDKIPRQGPSFISREFPLTPDETEHFGNAKVVKRIYRDGPDQFMLTAVDGSENRHAVHDPLYCYAGAGWKIINREFLPIEGGRAELLKLANGDRQTEVLFWFSDGTSRYTGPMRYWWETTLRRLSLGHSGPEPVLVVLEQVDNRPVNWHRLADGFAPLHEI